MPKKVNVLIFQVYVQKGQFRKRKSSLTMFLSSLVFIFSSPNKKSLKFYDYNISRHGALGFFSTIAPLLPLPVQNPLDHVNG